MLFAILTIKTSNLKIVIISRKTTYDTLELLSSSTIARKRKDEDFFSNIFYTSWIRLHIYIDSIVWYFVFS